MNVKDASSEGSGGKKEHIIGNWRKGYIYYIVADGITDLCPTVV